MSEKLSAEHGVVCRMAGERFGYFGWPSVARLDDGTLVVASSGLRTRHICPFGRTVLHLSRDDGRTWSAPKVINDSPLDDRDAGVICLGGRAMLVSWFTSDTRRYFEALKKNLSPDELREYEDIFRGWTDEVMAQWLGSWVILSDDGEQWSAPIRVPVNTPHGPIRLRSGDLLYLGKKGFEYRTTREGDLAACRSADRGRTWTTLGTVPLCEGTRSNNYHEAHVVEMTDGRLVGMIRFQYDGADDPVRDRQINFSLFQTESTDGGVTWSRARPTGVYGSPPHLLLHSTGVLVCVYGYRRPPCGQRAMLSYDGARSWQSDLVIRDDGPTGDLGYPASVEMPDGSLFTVYYQQAAPGEKCSLMWSRWKLP